MECPVCKKSGTCSSIELEDGLNASVCNDCGGHWISHTNYAAWLDTHSETLPEKPFLEVEFDVKDVQDAKLCPDCGRILLKYRVGHGLDFFIDHCPGCGGVWLDSNEWQALQEKNLHDEIHRIFSTTWQRQIRGEQMHEKLDQVYSARFGPDTYERLKEMRTWIQEHPHPRAMLAFLSDEAPYEI
jgi:Zn-finger nucleic acid-binding protein